MFTRRLRFAALNVLVLLATLTTTLLGPLPISVAAAHPLAGRQPGAGLMPQRPWHAAMPFSTSAQMNAPSNLCQLYPIGLGNTTIAGVAVGGTVSNITFGLQPSNFDWLTWAGNRSESTLLTSLTPPGNSSTYVNPSNSSDHSLDPGDSVNGDPLMPDDDAMKNKLNALKTQPITVPVFDQGSQNGDVRTLRVIGFASIQLTSYNLLNANVLSFTYQGSVTCTATQSGDTLLLSPNVAGPNVTGTSQSVQATLKDRAGNPISGVSLQFTVTGANATSGPATTDNNGQASFSYTSAHNGSDTIQASASSLGLNSNPASVAWVTPTQPISTTTVWGRFFTIGFPARGFVTPPTQAPVFTQAFPTLDFNPPPGMIPGTPTGVDDLARPMLDVTTDQNGAYTGAIPMQGNGYQAGAGALFEFQAVFTGVFLIPTAEQVTITFNRDDGYILGIGNGATFVSGDINNAPPTTPFEGYPVVSAENTLPFGSPGTSTVQFPGPGSYPFELDYFECCGGNLSLVVSTTTGTSQARIPSAGMLTLSPNAAQTLTAGSQQSFTTTVTDAMGNPVANQAVLLDVNGANAQQVSGTTNASGQVTLTYTGSNPGADTVQAVAWVSNQATYSAQVSIQWNPPATPPPTPPIATPGWIGSPASQSTLTAPTTITLATGITLASGTVDYWPVSNSSNVTTLATNVSGSGGATLATFDTTTLANGSYIIRLLGTDTTGYTQASEILVTVAGVNKPGRVNFTVTDLTVPVTGLPITIGRTYDSLLKGQSGDFGNGWTLALGNPQLTVDPAHNVTLTMPDGRRVTFYFTPQSAGGILGFLLLPAYTPEPGVYGTLSAQGCGLLANSGGQYFCFPGTLYQPTSYTYTDPYGRIYTLSPNGTLQSISDLNNNVLTFTPNGITSSAGNLNVPFVRDSQGRITTITDPAGNVYSYSYDGSGNLASVTLPGVSTPISYTYDSSHLLLTQKDPRGNVGITTTYDASGRLQTVTDALGNTTSYSYNLSTNTTSVTAPDGGTTSSTYDSFGMLLSLTDPLGNTTTYTYDSNHNLLSVTDPLGHKTTYTYDSQGNRLSATDPLNHTISAQYNQFSGPTTLTDAVGTIWTVNYDSSFRPTSVSDSLGTVGGYTWDSHGNPLTRVDGNGKITSLTYDQFGNLTSEKDPLGNVTSYTYDTLGRKLTSTDARGNTTKYTYDALGHVLTTTDPLGNVTTSTYDANGNQLTMTDALGHQTSYVYDVLNRLIKTTYPDNTTTSTTYDFRGNVLTSTDQAGHVTDYTYDQAGQQLTITTASGTPDVATTLFAYDAAGRQMKVTDPLGHATTSSYDNAGHLLTSTDPLGNVTTYTYNSDGLQTSVTDANGHKTSYTYDVRGRLTVTTYTDNTTTQQSYDGQGNVLSSTDQAGKVTKYSYDALGQLLSVTNPLNQATSYTYDPNGNLLTITDANNHQTSFTYDADNRQSKKTWPDGSFETFGYDAVGNQTSHQLTDGHTNTSTYDVLNQLSKLTYFDGTSVSYTYTPTGQRATVVDGRGTTSYSYDNQDRLIQLTTPGNQTLNYSYDAAGNRTGLGTPAGTVSYTYDNANRLSGVTSQGVGAFSYSYDKVGNRTQVTMPNGITESYSYDALNRLTSLTQTLGSQTLASYSYTLDPAGNRTKVTNADGSSVSWTYDTAYRLTGETDTASGGTTTFQASYAYDAVGNRTSATINGQMTSYTYNTLDQLTNAGSTQYSYDGRGNLTQISAGASVTTYTYDAADRLVSATAPNGASASYVYDADGRRVQQTSGSSVTNYLWDEASTYGDVVQETDGSGATKASYVLGNDQVLAETRSGTSSYYLYDGQGGVRALANGSGGITDQYTYDAFGNLLTSSGSTVNPYRYTGQQFDSLTGLYDLRARSYDPTTGRFTSRDTASIDFNNPVELNRYSYVQDNPINLTDPSGHDPDDEYSETLAGLLGILSKVPPIVIAAVFASVLLFVLTILYFTAFYGVLVGSNPQMQPGTPPVGYPTPTPDKNLYIYRQGPDRLKTVALNRFVDFVSGLSFFLTPRSGENLRYKVQDLISAGYMVRPDAGGSPVTDVRTGKNPPDPNDYPIKDYPEQDPRIFQPNTFLNNGHVTVWLPFIPNWDTWYHQERSQKGVPGQQYQASPWTVRLYNIPHQLVVAP